MLEAGGPARGASGNFLQLERPTHIGGVVPFVPAAGHAQAVGLVDLPLERKAQEQDEQTEEDIRFL
ncbi:MAG: hypothetical protein PF694_09625 [Bacteroidetes bacterium]|nr:hypothetical protein [Bacteroidota bacterium]